MAKASEMRLGPYPNSCWVCGARVVLTGTRPLWFTWERGTLRSAHFDCEIRNGKREGKR